MMTTDRGTRQAAICILPLLLWPVCAQDMETRNGELFQWTDWMDDEDGGPIDPSSIGEFEILSALRQQYNFCDDVVDIECRLASPPHTLYDETGQVSLTCSPSSGFMCFHSQQSGDCFNYKIRVLCPHVGGSTSMQDLKSGNAKIPTEPSKTTQRSTEAAFGTTQAPFGTERVTSQKNEMANVPDISPTHASRPVITLNGKTTQRSTEAAFGSTEATFGRNEATFGTERVTSQKNEMATVPDISPTHASRPMVTLNGKTTQRSTEAAFGSNEATFGTERVASKKNEMATHASRPVVTLKTRLTKTILRQRITSTKTYSNVGAKRQQWKANRIRPQPCKLLQKQQNKSREAAMWIQIYAYFSQLNAYIRTVLSRFQ
ncbi:mucin-5B-like [Ptychodera flava]|uniref:mucin-5B-like n=1 Tax=Ptychodera flava TaxID=63121 RepID=UPI00396A2FA7